MRQSDRTKPPIVFRIGLVLVCAMFITVGMVGGLYARYSSTATGGLTATTAKMECKVNYGYSGYGEIGDVSGDNNIVFALIEEFSVENTGEVSYGYDMKLKLSEDITSATYENPAEPPSGFSLYAPRDVGTADDMVTYMYHSSADSTVGTKAEKTASELVGFDKFTQNKVYYAYSDDGTNYTWAEAGLDGEELSLPNRDLAYGETHYYKVMYFIHVTGSTNLQQQQVAMLYNIECSQID